MFLVYGGKFYYPKKSASKDMTPFLFDQSQVASQKGGNIFIRNQI